MFYRTANAWVTERTMMDNGILCVEAERIDGVVAHLCGNGDSWSEWCLTEEEAISQIQPVPVKEIESLVEKLKELEGLKFEMQQEK